MKKNIIKANIIKGYSLILLVLLCGLFSSCMNGDWDEPDTTVAPFGNNSIDSTNVITIAELIKKYPNVFASTDQNKLIEDDIQIKGRVTGNDLGGNIYKQIIIQDKTAAIIIAVNEGGLYGHIAEGQEILVDLKGLYIGGYRKMPEIGYPYNGNSIGRMQKDIWEKHYKIIEKPDIAPIDSVDFNSIKNDMNANCGKLVTLKGVTFSSADGKATFTTGSSVGNAVNQTLDGYGSNVVIRTSTYADFAAMILPYDTNAKKKLSTDITGIATRYNNTWQILIRKTSDIKVAE